MHCKREIYAICASTFNLSIASYKMSKLAHVLNLQFSDSLIFAVLAADRTLDELCAALIKFHVRKCMRNLESWTIAPTAEFWTGLHYNEYRRPEVES